MAETIFQKYIKRKGITMYAISKSTGVHQNTLNNAFKKSVSQASVRIIQALADTLDMSVGSLLEELINLEKGVFRMKKGFVSYSYQISINESYEKSGSPYTSFAFSINATSVIDNKGLTKKIHDFFIASVNLKEVEENVSFFDLNYDISKILEFVKESKESNDKRESKYEEDYFEIELIAIDADLSDYLEDNQKYKLELYENYPYKNREEYYYTDDVTLVYLKKENANFSIIRPEKGKSSYFFLYGEDNECVESELIVTPL